MSAVPRLPDRTPVEKIIRFCASLEIIYEDDVHSDHSAL
jgi:hypothetical protein